MKKYLLVLIFISSSLAPAAHAESTSIEVLLARIAQLQQSLNVLQSKTGQQPTVLYSGNSSWSYNRSIEGQPVGSEVDKGAAYEETGDDDDYFNVFSLYRSTLRTSDKMSDDVKADSREVWDVIINTLSTAKAKQHVKKFVTYEDPDQPVLGFVVGSSKDAKNWVFGLNIAGIDMQNDKWVRDAIIVTLHEYAHMITLNRSEVSYYSAGNHKCEREGRYTFNNYRTCAKADSYLSNFVDQFWTEEKIEQAENRLAYKKSPIYNLYPAAFVTKYAATSPGEDIAESFVDFVLQQKPTGYTEREAKIRFFYDYPELVKYRESVRERIKNYF